MVKVPNDPNRSFDPGYNPPFQDAARNTGSDPDWANYRNNTYRAGNSSTVPDAPGTQALGWLLDTVREINPNASFATDAFGRQVVQVNQKKGDDFVASHLHYNPQTGGIQVNSPSSPAGGYHIQDQITDMNRLQEHIGGMQQKPTNAQEFLSAATSAGAFKTKEHVLKDMLTRPEPLYQQAAKSSHGKPGEDGSTWLNYDPMLTSPQREVKLATSISLPAYSRNQDGSKQRTGVNEVASFLEATGSKDFFGNKGNGTSLTNIGALMPALVPVNEAGEADSAKSKRFSNYGLRDTSPVFRTPDANGMAPQMTSPFRMAGSPRADKGQRERVLYLQGNVLTPEGQAWVRPGMGQLGVPVDRAIDMPAGGLEGLGLTTGTLNNEQRKRFEDLTGKNTSSYPQFSLDAIEVNNKNQVALRGTGYVPVSGSSSKTNMKAGIAVAGEDSGIIPQGRCCSGPRYVGWYVFRHR
jgi:hypothetical protein